MLLFGTSRKNDIVDLSIHPRGCLLSPVTSRILGSFNPFSTGGMYIDQQLSPRLSPNSMNGMSWENIHLKASQVGFLTSKSAPSSLFPSLLQSQLSQAGQEKT